MRELFRKGLAEAMVEVGTAPVPPRATLSLVMLDSGQRQW